MNPALDAWQHYLATGGLDARRLRQPVYRAWERSHLGGADPRRMKSETLADLDLERLLVKEDALIAAGRPYLRALSRAAGKERHAAMLGDRRAVVLDVVGDEQSVHGPERVPGPGALLSEALSGSNGIGTPLAEDGYAELVGPEHFIGGFHAFTCQGVPVRGASGETAGVLSVSLRSPRAAFRLREILICAAHGIEAELYRLRLEDDIRRVLASTPDDDAPLERLRQDVVQLQAAARLGLEGAASHLTRDRWGDALRLVATAQNSAREFLRRARVFQDLASPEVGPLQPVELAAQIRELLSLFGTEAATRRVELVAGELVPQIVEADPRSLLRNLLRMLLESFEVAQHGGAVELKAQPSGGMARLTITASPPPGSDAHPHTTHVELPLRRLVQP